MNNLTPFIAPNDHTHNCHNAIVHSWTSDETLVVLYNRTMSVNAKVKQPMNNVTRVLTNIAYNTQSLVDSVNKLEACDF